MGLYFLIRLICLLHAFVLFRLHHLTKMMIKVFISDS